MKHASPLRYPGGKARLTSLLRDLLDLNALDNCDYYEPFAGGAGAAMTLLDLAVVTRVHLNDADYRVYAFWRSCIHEADRFAARILDVPVTVEEWRRQQRICLAPSKHSRFDTGFAAFYMNRCNRSGVLTGAGPIGGYKQSGAWRLDVRFNRQALATRVEQLGRLRSKIVLSNKDALDFLKTSLPRGSQRQKVFVYLDPPYVQKGQRLYLNAYERQDHRRLSSYLQSQKSLHWFASYDDTPLIRDLYAGVKVSVLPIQYSLQVKRVAHELAIAPNHVALPAICRPMPQALLLQRAS